MTGTYLIGGDLVEGISAMVVEFSHSELPEVYNSTLEGWAHALALRDKGTEGHAQRVANITERLGRAMGLSEIDLLHIRRGALLHDIGKIGIPDSILLKPGPLTEEEWIIMRKHPVYAYEMLAPIAYLRPALDIPHYHHEKWNGAGYPSGLKGYEIPLSARLFAIADIWDALTSDRHYRIGWSKERSHQYILEQSGKQIDPQIVTAFFNVLESKL